MRPPFPTGVWGHVDQPPADAALEAVKIEPAGSAFLVITREGGQEFDVWLETEGEVVELLERLTVRWPARHDARGAQMMQLTPKLEEEVLKIASGLANELPEFDGPLGLLFALADRIREDGAVLIVKLDGERNAPGDAPPYTVFISSGPIAEGIIRDDSPRLADSLARVIIAYAARYWQPSGA